MPKVCEFAMPAFVKNIKGPLDRQVVKIISLIKMERIFISMTGQENFPLSCASWQPSDYAPHYVQGQTAFCTQM